MSDAIKVPLKQNPHAVRGDNERWLEVAIGREVRALPKQIGITVADLAEGCGLSVGMLSKIENGLTSPSLTTLQSLAHALGVPVTYLMRKIEEERPCKVTLRHLLINLSFLKIDRGRYLVYKTPI